MSFKRFDQQDIVISSDSVTSPAWSDNEGTLTAFYTSSDQVARTSGDYYWNIYQSATTNDNSAIQFSIAYGDLKGSGSLAFNPGALENTPSSVIYKQFRTLVNGTEETNLKFNGVESEYIYAISVERARYKEKLLPGSMTLKLSVGGNDLFLTDNSNYIAAETFGDAGREYEIVSGSSGTRFTGAGTDGVYGYSPSNGSFGKFLPDVGVILLNGPALANSSLAMSFPRNSNTDDNQINTLYSALSSITLRSEETVSSNYVFIRARNSEFNYSTNPSNITGSGELRHSVMIDSPQSYVTTVGLYNDNNDLLAVAKLSRPLIKDFTKEALIRVKLDY